MKIQTQLKATFFSKEKERVQKAQIEEEEEKITREHIFIQGMDFRELDLDQENHKSFVVCFF